MSDERAAFEAEEIRALARQYGAKREIVDGVAVWRFPPYVCAHCGPGTAPPLPDCPEALAAHRFDQVQADRSWDAHALVWWHHGRRQRTEYPTLAHATAAAQGLIDSHSGSPDYVIHRGATVWRHDTRTQEEPR